MLGRRHLRVRVLQALYTFFQTDEPNLAAIEQEMFNGTKRFYDLYISLLSLFAELAHHENLYLQDVSPKFITQKKKIYRTFGELKFVQWLQQSEQFKLVVVANKISWQNETDLVAKSFFKIKKTSATIKPSLNQCFLKKSSASPKTIKRLSARRRIFCFAVLSATI